MPPIMRRISRYCAVGTLIFAASFVGAIAQTPHVTDLQGHEITQLATAEKRIVVLIFAATDCPISNRYIPEITRLDKDLAAHGVAFWWVFPNPGDTLTMVQKHGQDFSITTPTLIDSQQELVHMAHVTVTPEAAIFAVDHSNLHEVYHGRIDDRYIAFGQERPQATQHELEDAIHAALQGQPIPKPTPQPVGCSIIPVTPVVPHP
jgi:hypothetical protein